MSARVRVHLGCSFDGFIAGENDDLSFLTMVPVVVGAGISLFGGIEKRHALEYLGTYRYRGRGLQVHVRPVREPR